MGEDDVRSERTGQLEELRQVFERRGFGRTESIEVIGEYCSSRANGRELKRLMRLFELVLPRSGLSFI